MKKRTIGLGVITLASIFILGACSGQSKDSSTTKNGLQVKIMDGEYITTKDLKSSSSSKGYLALQVKLTNKGDKSIPYGTDSFSLTTKEDGEAIEPSNVYDSQNQFKTISYGKVSKGQTKSGYLVYEVDKKEKDYELVVESTIPGEDETEVKIPINASKYDDNSEKVKDLAKTFVTQTFLDDKATIDGADAEAASTSGDAEVELLAKKTEKSDKWELANKADEDRSAYMKAFVEAAKEGWSYYKPGDGEAQKFAQQYIAANSKRAQVEYTVKDYLPTSATVTVKPSVINFNDIDTDSLKDEYIKQHKDDNFSDYDALYRDAEKFIFENVHTRYDAAQLSTPDYMPGDGYELKLTKDTDTGKWTVDTSDADSNYDYKNLIDAFIGGI